MKYRSLLLPLCLSCFLCGIPAAHAQRTGVALTIPDAMFGTYDLEMDAATNSTLYPDGTLVTLTLAIDGSLCANGLKLSTPTVRDGITSKYYWSSTAIGFEFSLQTAGGFGGFVLASPLGGITQQVIYGTLRGEKADTTDSCDINTALFELAEANYPELFPESIFVRTQTSALDFHRYYSATDTYLSIINGRAYASGGTYGVSPVSLGLVANLVRDGIDHLLVPVIQTPLAFDDYYTSTYNLSFTNATTFSPIQNGVGVTAVITADDRLCIGGTVLSSPLYGSGTGRVIWNNPDAGHYYVLQLMSEAEKAANIQSGQLDVYSTGGQYLGSFEGNRAQLSAECSDAQGETPDLTEINLMFQLAEQRLAHLFPGGPQTYNQKNNGYIFRHYADTGITIQVKDRVVQGKGGIFGPAFVTVGTLNTVIADLQARTMPVVLKSALTGTYGVTFSSSGDFSPIPGGSSFDVALTDDGDICLDGVVLSTPYQDLNDPDLVYWESPNTGFTLQLDVGASNGTDIELIMLSDAGLELGTLSGTRSQLLAQCAGVLGGNLDVAAANELFALAEQVYSDKFPASALTFNQLNGSNLLRYYPSTGILVTMTGPDVYVSGGPYGSAQRSVGTITSLLQALRPPTPVTPASPPFAMRVTGDVLMATGTLAPINRKIDLRKSDVVLPVNTESATLTALVQQVLGNELKGSSTFTFTNIVSTASTLQFDVRIANVTVVATTVVARDYALHFSFTRE